MISVQFNFAINTQTSTKSEIEGRITSLNTASFWKTIENCSVDELINQIKAGYAYRGGIKNRGNAKNHITSCQLVALDFDSSLIADTLSNPYTKSALLWHHSPSFQDGVNEKHRLLFILSRACTVAETEKILEVLLHYYPQADQSCNDAGRFYFGISAGGRVEVLSKSAVLDVEALLAQTVPGKKAKAIKGFKKATAKTTTKKPVEDSQESKPKKPKKNILDEVREDKKAENDFILSILESVDGDINKMFCLYDHALSEVSIGGVDSSQGWDYKWQGSNPFSETDSSGTSFLVSMREGEPPAWFDRSRGKASQIYNNHGGTFLEYWHSQRFAEKSFNRDEIINDIAEFFGVESPKKNYMMQVKEMLEGRFRGQLKLNELTQQITYWGKPVDLDTIRFDVAEWLGVSIMNKDMLIELVQTIAKDNSYHPIKDYLLSVYSEKQSELSSFDFDHLADRIFGTDNPLYNNYLQNWLSAAVARVLSDVPVKYDHVLIIRGKQGRGKSTFFETLASYKWFCEDISPTAHNQKDEILKLIQTWIVELGEIEGVTRRADVEALRQFVTRTTENVRLPYSRDTKVLPRRFVLGGTANSKVVWNDSQGNRRAHIVDIEDRWIDNPYVKANRDLIWAAAVKRYLDNKDDLGAILSLNFEQEQQRQELNNNHIDHEVAQEQILKVAKEFTLRNGYVRFEDFLKAFYPDSPLKMSPQDKRRITQVLEENGYNLKQKRTSDGGRVYAFHPETLISTPIETPPETTSEAQPVPQPQQHPQDTQQQPLEALKPKETNQATIPAPLPDTQPKQPLLMIDSEIKPDSVPSNGQVKLTNYDPNDIFQQLLE